MKASISNTWLLMLIVIFTFIFAGYMAVTISYTHAFKLKNEALTIVEKHRGMTNKVGENIQSSINPGETVVGKLGTLQTINAYLVGMSYKIKHHCPSPDNAVSGYTDVSEWYGVKDLNVDSSVSVDKNPHGNNYYYCFARVEKNTGNGRKISYYRLVFFYKLEIPILGDLHTFEIDGITNNIVEDSFAYVGGGVLGIAEPPAPTVYNFFKSNSAGFVSKCGTASDSNSIPSTCLEAGFDVTIDHKTGNRVYLKKELNGAAPATYSCDMTGWSTDFTGIQGISYYQDRNLLSPIDGAVQGNLPTYSIFTIQGIRTTDSMWLIKIPGNDKCFLINSKASGKWDVFVNAAQYIPEVTWDIKNLYDSSYHFYNSEIPGLTHARLYGNGYSNSWVPLNPEMASKLKAAAAAANTASRTIVVHDAYRPKNVTDYAFNLVKAAARGREYELFYPYDVSWFAARNNSAHNCGEAVDVTLAGANMPTSITEVDKYAAIRPNSGANRTNIIFDVSDSIKSNYHVIQLRSFMLSSGLYDLKSEWWHFQLRTSNCTAAQPEQALWSLV